VTDRGAKAAGDPLADPPKIVFVNRYFYPDQSATSQLLTDLAHALAEAGFKIHVICSRQRYDDASIRLAPRESFAGVAIHRVWTTRFGRRRLLGRALDYATFYGSSAVQMIRLLKRDDTVVAKTDPPLISIVAMFAAQLKGAQLINWLQDVFPEVASLLGANPLPRALNAGLRRCRDLSLRSAHANIVLGERMRERLLGAGIPSESIQIIENWAELRPDKPKPAASSVLRSKLGLDDHFVVGYSGNLGRAHEFQTLLGAAETLRTDPRFVFLMIGGGIGMTQLERDVGDRGLANFRFLAYQPRESLSDCLAAADVHWVSLRPVLEGFIVPSKFYGILAAARPVMFIGDPDGELARDIRRCACGASVNVGESALLAQLLTAWQSDPALLERMGEAGYRRYCERYSARRAFDQWIRILKSRNRVDGVSPPALSNR
jgi:colanic acid biosynthesis glycosyl transferase WcaI